MKQQIKCDFTSVNLQLEQRTIRCKISRDNLTLETADGLFADHRLTGTIEVVRGDEADEQLPLIGGTLPTVSAVFDVKRYSVGPKEISCSFVFSKDSIDPATLDGFLQRSGRITVTNVGQIPEKEDD